MSHESIASFESPKCLTACFLPLLLHTNFKGAHKGLQVQEQMEKIDEMAPPSEKGGRGEQGIQGFWLLYPPMKKIQLAVRRK
jgi:hypothetical protein